MRALSTLRHSVVAQLKLAYLESRLPVSVCSWCNQVLDDGCGEYPHGAPLLNHGICETCTDEARAELN